MPPGTVGTPLEGGGVVVAAGDGRAAVHRICCNARSVSPSEVCSPGERLGDGTSG